MKKATKTSPASANAKHDTVFASTIANMEATAQSHGNRRLMLVLRAVRAHFLAQKDSEQRWDVADPRTSTVELDNGKREHVLLRSRDGAVLAVFRVKNNGFLKRLKRWPQEFEVIA